MERILLNTVGTPVRRTLHGRDYLVATATLIVPGVLNGSQGALFYPPDEVARDPWAWNGMPIVGYHPLVNGVHVSGRDPDILASQGLGNVYRAKAGDALSAELWFDVDAVRNFDTKLEQSLRILPRLEAGKPIEISTGLFTENTPAEDGAVHNGKAYTHIARNYRPDHLAVLPDQKGACSIDDGCGINVNADSGFVRMVKAIYDKLLGNSSNVQPVTDKSTVNPQEDTNMATREQNIQFLTANCDCWKGKEKVLANKDAFTDEDLAKLKANADKMQTLVANAAKTAKPGCEEEEEETMKKKEPAANADKKPLTDAEWLASAPTGIQSAVRNAMAVEKRERQRIIGQLVANVAETERDDIAKELNTESLEKLQKLLKLVPTGNAGPANEPLYILPGNFQGAAGGPVGGGVKDDSDNVLPTFNINWDEAAKQAV